MKIFLLTYVVGIFALTTQAQTTTPFNNCDAKANWTTTLADGGIFTVNTKDFKDGTGALEIANKSISSPLVFIYKNEVPIDSKITNASKANFKIWLYIDKVENLGGVPGQIEVSSSLKNDEDEYGWTFKSLNLKSGWNELNLPFNKSIKKDNPDLSKIVRLRIYQGTTDVTTWRIDDMKFIQN